VTEFRASFDATVTFANGGRLDVEGFRVDVPSNDVAPDEVAHLFVSSLSLLMMTSGTGPALGPAHARTRVL